MISREKPSEVRAGNESPQFILDEIRFEYDSISKSECVYSTTLDLNLTTYNAISLYFAVSGDQTNSEGLKVTFYVKDIITQFIVDRYYQNGETHNLTQTFSLPENYNGFVDVTIICEGQSSYLNQKGTLIIREQTSIKPIPILTLNNNIDNLPIVPEYLWFQGNIGTSKSESIVSKFICLNASLSLNLTLMFKSKEFSSSSQDYTIKLNNEILVTEKFDDGIEIKDNHILPIQEGLNTIEIFFTIVQCLTYIEIYDIGLQANAFSYEKYLEEVCFDFVQLSEENNNQIIVLSDLKPSESKIECVLLISLDYDCLGDISWSELNYEIFSGTDKINDGIITDSDSYSSKTLRVETYTKNFNEILYLRLFGEVEGEGMFLLLRTSYISTNDIFLLEDRIIDKTLSEDKVFSIEPNKPKILEFYEVLKITDLENSETQLGVIIDCYSTYDRHIDYVTIVVILGEEKIIDSVIAFTSNTTRCDKRKTINFNSKYNEIRIIISIYGDDDTVEFNQIKLLVIPTNVFSQIELPTAINVSMDILWSLYGLILLKLVGGYFSRRRKIVKISQEPQLENEPTEIRNTKKESVKQLCVAITISTITYLLMFYFMVLVVHFNSLIAFTISLIYGVFVGYISDSLELYKIRIKDLKAKLVQRRFSDANTCESSSRFMNFFSSSEFLILRATIILTVLLFCWRCMDFLFILYTEIYSANFSVKYYWFFYAVIALSVAMLQWSIKLSLNFTFLEDNLKRVRIFGLVLIGLILSFWFPIIFSVIIQTKNLEILLTVFTPLFLGLNVYFSNFLGKRIAMENNEFFRNFRKRGIIFTKQEDVKQALSWNITTRKEWIKKKNEEKRKKDKEKLRSKILCEIEEKDPVYLRRLSELIDETAETTEIYLQEILEEDKELGTYNKGSQVFRKNKIENNVEYLNLMQVNETEIDVREKDAEPTVELSTIRNDDEEDLENIHFIKFNKQSGLFRINQELEKIIAKLKNGDKIILVHRNESGEEMEKTISFEFLADGHSSALVLAKALMQRIRGLVKQANKTATEYWGEQKIDFSSLDEEKKRIHLSTLAMRINVGLSVSKIFTKEQFERDAVLFWNDDYESFAKDAEPMDILSANLSTTLKGEFAIIMVFIQSLLLMQKDSLEANRKRFNKIKENLERRRKELEVGSVKEGCLCYTLTDYYNPFIKLIYSIDENGIAKLVGWEFIRPEERSYVNSLWGEKLPYNPENEGSVIEAIKNEWENLSTRRKEKEFNNLPEITQKKITRFVEKNYGKGTSLLALYAHLRYFSDVSTQKFKEKIQAILKFFPTEIADWSLYIVDRQIQWINRGQDMFGSTAYLLMRSRINERGEVYSYALPNPSPSGHKWLREGWAEIEAKSGWDKNPKALDTNLIRFTNNPEHGSSIYLSDDSLFQIAKAVKRKEYDVLVKHKGKKKKISELITAKSGYRQIAGMLKGDYFNIIFRSIDRVDINTAISTQKHLLRRLLDATVTFPHLITNDEWLEALTSKENSNQFFELVQAVITNKPEWKGLRLQPVEDNKVVKEIFSEFFSSLLYYNILLFASGLPVLQFNQDLLNKGFYLPQTIGLDEDMKQIKLNTKEPPVYRNIRGRLTQLVYGGTNLSVMITIPRANKPLLVDLSHNTFQRPIYVRRIIEDVHLEEKIVYAPRVMVNGKEKVIILSSQGYVLKELVLAADKRETMVLTSAHETVYGAVAVVEGGLYVNSYARQMLTQLLIYGGMHIDGKVYEAVIELFNKEKVDSLTLEPKQTPFLFFSLISATRARGEGQLKGLTSPVKHQIKKGRKEYNYQHRPVILGVALTSMEEMLCKEVDYSIAFGSGLEKYDLLYWNRSRVKGEKDVRYNVKGKNGYVNKLLHTFQLVFRNAFNIVSMEGKGGERIHQQLWARVHNKRVEVSFTKPNEEKWHNANLSIPLITTNKYSKKDCYYSIKTIAQRIPHILLSKDISERRINDLKKISMSFLLMMKYSEESFHNKIQNSVWKSLRKIAVKYNIEKQPLIDRKDWAKIITFLFPEVLKASRLISSTHAEKFKKQSLKSINIDELEKTNPNPDELLKIFPPETRSDWHLRVPYHAFFIFFGYYLGNNWTLLYTKTNSHKKYNKVSNSKPDSLIEKVYRLYVPWLFWRAEALKTYFEEGMNGYSSIHELLCKGLLDKELRGLLDYTYQDIITTQDFSSQVVSHKKLTFIEKMIWFHIKEVQILDIIAFNHSGSFQIMDEITKNFGEFDKIQEVAENIDSLFELV
ncbi:MAG: hypothetical protein GOP50_06145 [Candidatus Heimdallarchaeota archaeon]|nr:hypothetical protein [Candidatus Heimdallarchaeota archaeon]